MAAARTSARRDTSDVGLLSIITRNSDVALAITVLAVIGLMIVPVPPMVLSLLIVANFAASVTIMLIAMYTREVLSFSVFPSLLLLVTLFRLAINIASTRLILLYGDAGSVIDAFGEFVIGGSLIVGIVVFLILLVIQFVVITNGAGRVAEVAARFTLDAMPGKQMSIDADLNAGLISDTEARTRRAKISAEADFYGAMDGASKFVKGDAVAGLIITSINLIGGMTIGIVQQGLAPGEAVSAFSILTVGDGLVSQIPALLVSTATGIIVTRAASEGHLGQDIGGQLFSNPRVMFIVAGILTTFGLVPGLPRSPFFIIAAIMGGAGYLLRQRQRARAVEVAEAREVEDRDEAQSVDSVVNMLRVDPLEVEVGYGLIPLVDGEHGGNLLHRITIMRRQIATDLGIVVPMIRIRDNLSLPANQYVLKLRGIEIGGGQLLAGQFLAMDSGLATAEIAGTATTEPAFGLPARWIAPADKQQAEFLGYTVVDPPSVLITHVSELIKRHSPELLSRQDVQTLLNHLKEEYPAVVDELVPGILTVGEVQGVLQLLLAEGVSVRDLVTIAETLADLGRQTKEIEALTEGVRTALARQITMQHRAADNRIHAMTLNPRLEQSLAQALTPTDAGMALVVSPELLQRLLTAVAAQLERAAAQGRQPVLLTSSRIRRPLRRLLERSVPALPVIAFAEIAREVEVEAIAQVEVEYAAA
ncbi:MAG: flagellar biosynthesis protein FlhA [Chloroflexi bacterium HGW-Chloroflexi-9]|nr:MAG: flagellar biosynthesis protein FlhA [Chloroflexi bacterium HGW-Chloroflexi-9]